MAHVAGGAVDAVLLRVVLPQRTVAVIYLLGKWDPGDGGGHRRRFSSAGRQTDTTENVFRKESAKCR